MPVLASELHVQILPRVYDQDIMSEGGIVDSHRLALVCMVLAVGTFFDMDNPDYAADALYWYHLCRAALSLHSIMLYPSIPATQTLVRPWLFDVTWIEQRLTRDTSS